MPAQAKPQKPARARLKTNPQFPLPTGHRPVSHGPQPLLKWELLRICIFVQTFFRTEIIGVDPHVCFTSLRYHPASISCRTSSVAFVRIGLLRRSVCTWKLYERVRGKTSVFLSADGHTIILCGNSPPRVIHLYKQFYVDLLMHKVFMKTSVHDKFADFLRR